MAETLTPEICVIGAGSGGLTVAAASASFGLDVVLLEKHKMGGDCLNFGCVPSKAIIAAGKTAHTFRTSDKFGIKSQEPEVNFKAVHDHIHGVIGEIAPNDSVERFTGLGVNVIQEAGKFIDKKTVQAGDTLIKAKKFVIATGSSAFVPPIPGIEDVNYLTNETIFDNTRNPGHLIIIGGGPIGMEMAQAHRRLGAEVTVIEGLKAFGKDDPELTAIVIDQIRKEGVDLLEGAKVVQVEPRGKTGVAVTVETADGQEVITGNKLLVATGRKANVDGLGLDEAGIEYDRRGIKVNKSMRSSNSRVYAIGDVAGGFQFTHVAGYHATVFLRGLLSPFGAKENTDIIPWATFTDPELAHVGLNEDQARERHGDIRIMRWPYAENDRAQAEHKTHGMIKVITNKKGVVLGASIVGANAGELINIWSLAVSSKLKLSAFTGYVAPYPTMGEIAKRAATEFYKPATQGKAFKLLVSVMRRFW